MKRALNNEHGEKLKHDITNLFMTIEDVIVNIGVKQSHVLLASIQDARSIINMNKNKYSKMVRISNQHYFDKMDGYIFNKNTNPVLKDAFEKM